MLAQSINRNVNRNVGVSYCVRNDSLERYVLLNLSVNGQQAEGRCDSPSFPVGLKLQLLSSRAVDLEVKSNENSTQKQLDDAVTQAIKGMTWIYLPVA